MQFTREEVEAILRRHVEKEFQVKAGQAGEVTFHGIYLKEQSCWRLDGASVDVDTKNTGSPYR